MIDWNNFEVRLVAWLTALALFFILTVLICYATGFLTVHVTVDNGNSLRM